MSHLIICFHVPYMKLHSSLSELLTLKKINMLLQPLNALFTYYSVRIHYLGKCVDSFGRACEQRAEEENNFAKSLALADLFVGIFLLHFSNALKNFITTPLEALPIELISQMVVHASVMHLLAIAADRFAVVLFPLRYTVFEQKIHIGMILASWIFALTISFLAQDVTVTRPMPTVKVANYIMHITD